MIFPSNAENHENMIFTLSVFTNIVFHAVVLIKSFIKSFFKTR